MTLARPLNSSLLGCLPTTNRNRNGSALSQSGRVAGFHRPHLERELRPRRRRMVLTSVGWWVPNQACLVACKCCEACPRRPTTLCKSLATHALVKALVGTIPLKPTAKRTRPTVASLVLGVHTSMTTRSTSTRSDSIPGRARALFAGARGTPGVGVVGCHGRQHILAAAQCEVEPHQLLP